MILDATTTPPVTNYSLFLNMMDPVTIDVTYCSFITLTNGVNDYTVNITANNIVGSSKPISDTFSKFISRIVHCTIFYRCYNMSVMLMWLIQVLLFNIQLLIVWKIHRIIMYNWYIVTPHLLCHMYPVLQPVLY